MSHEQLELQPLLDPSVLLSTSVKWKIGYLLSGLIVMHVFSHKVLTLNGSCDVVSPRLLFSSNSFSVLYVMLSVTRTSQKPRLSINFHGENISKNNNRMEDKLLDRNKKYFIKKNLSR